MKKKKESLDLQDLNFNGLIILEDSFSDIKFFEKDHHYEIDGKRAKMSVSQLISKYEKPFDKSIAHRVAKRDGKLVEDILWQWDYNKDYSCHKGNEFHLMVEEFYQRRTTPIDKDSIRGFLENRIQNYHIDGDDYLANYYMEMAHMIKNFKNFYDWWKQDHILLKSEFVIGDKEKGVCGTIDNLSYNKKTNKLALFDYKTNKEIKREGYKGETMLAPIDSVPKCELGKYSLQLCLYKLILERNTPFEVGECNIVWVAGKEDYELINIIDLEKEAKTLFDHV
jgi:ATP-dependent exoDNAse (exonuclease V) beta subunit